MYFASFIASVAISVASLGIETTSDLYTKNTPKCGIRTCFTKTHKYSILQCEEFKTRQNNIQRLSTSIETPKLYHIKKSDTSSYILQYPLPMNNVKTYVSENYCSPFILYTIINQCCNNLALYHGLLNCYHSNTTVANFDINDMHLCKLSDIGTDDKLLTLNTKKKDYDILFDSYIDALSIKNSHFLTIAFMFRKTFMSKLISKPSSYPEEPKPPSPLLLTSTFDTSCISG